MGLTRGRQDLLCFILIFCYRFLLIYQMVQMFWHNSLGWHYLFVMLSLVIVFYTFGILNYVPVRISISKKSVPPALRSLRFSVLTESIPTSPHWMTKTFLM